MSINSMIKAMVQTELAQAIADAVREVVGENSVLTIEKVTRDATTDKHGRSIDDPSFGVPARQSAIPVRSFAGVRSDVETVTRRAGRRGRGRAKVAYVLVARRKGERWPSLVGNPQSVLNAIRANDGPMTNVEIETVTGMGNKAVQSAVYLLRTMNVIRSKAVR